MSILTWVSEDTPKELRVELLNDNTFKNDGRIAQGKFDKNELDTIYSAFAMDRQYQREISLGHLVGDYTDWTHFKAESQYSIWKIAVSDYQHNSINMMYLDEKGLDYRGQATSENLTAFDKVYLYNGDSGAGYTDNSTEAATEYGVAFNAMDSTSDYWYIGDANTFAGFDIDLAQFGSGYTLKVEYYSGASGAPWTQLLTTTNSLVDNTSNLTGSARVTFDIPGDWGSVSLFSGDVAKKYVRVSTTTTPSTVATVYHVLPIDNVASILSMSQTKINDEEWSWCYYSGSVYVSIPNTGDRNYEGNRFVSSLSSTANIQNYFIYNHEYKIDYEDSSYTVLPPSITSVKLYDIGENYTLELDWNEAGSTNQTLYFKVNNGNREINLTGNPTLDDWFDQNVKSGQAPTFTADNFSDGGGNAIITTTQETNFETAYTHSQDNTQAHSDYLLNNESDITSGSLTMDDLLLYDTNASHTCTVHWNEDEASANRTLNFTMNGGDRAVSLSGNLTVEAASVINSDLSTDANWATSGSITGNSFITASDIGIVGDTDIIQITAANKIKFNSLILSIGANAPGESWGTALIVAEFGGNASIIGGGGAGAGNDFHLAQNAYYDNTDSRWEFQDTDAASLYTQIAGTHIFSVAASGTADTAITWTTAVTIAVTGNVGVGVAANAAIRLYVKTPDAQSATYFGGVFYTESDATNNYGVYGQATGGGGTNNYGVFGEAVNAGTRNDHFRSIDGDYCSGGGWTDSCHSSRKRLIRDLNANEDVQLYAMLDKLNVKAYRHTAEIPIIDYDEENMMVDDIGREVPTPIYDEASVAPERYGLMADDDDLPEFLRSKGREGLSPGRRVSYMEICVKYQKKLIENQVVLLSQQDTKIIQLEKRIVVLEGV